MAFDREEWNKRREERARRKEQAAKQQKKELYVLCGIAGFLIMAIVAVLVILLAGRGGNQPETQPGDQTAQTQTGETAPPTTVPPTTQSPDTVIHLVAGGDLNISEKVVASGKTDTGYDYQKLLVDVLPVLAEGDVTMLNFEGCVAGTPYGADSAPAELLTALDAAGVDLLQTANSRSVSNGLLGLTSTISAIRAAGMEPVGTFASSQEFRKKGGFTMLEVQGIRIAVVAFTKGMDGRGIPAGSEDCVNLLYTDYNSTYQTVDTDGITKILKNIADEEPDITIAMLHWGSEYNNTISATQKKICELMQEQGVDAIIGTHPHYVQQMTLDEKTGQFVAYSLGDFLSDGTQSGTNYSALLDLQITKDGITGETKITGFDYTPIYMLDETENGGGLRLLRIREAMDAYHNQAVGGIPEVDFQAMTQALERLEAKIHGK